VRYITVLEYLGSTPLSSLPPEQVANLNTLIPKINDLLSRFGEFRKCNSGYRSMEEHLAIYARINARRKAQGLPERKVPMSSRHLVAAAIDLEDRDGKLKAWLVNNVKILEKLDLYCEHGSATPTWAHIQIIKPASGSRFFKP
jgi:hypothetical protein